MTITDEQIKAVRVWRMYPNGELLEQTHVLYPHRSDGQQCTGYDGDVSAWSEHNKQWRGGCAQIVKREGCGAEVVYQGSVDVEMTAQAIRDVMGADNETTN